MAPALRLECSGRGHPAGDAHSIPGRPEAANRLLAVIAGRFFLFPEAGELPVQPAGAGDGETFNVGVRLLSNYVVAIQLAGVVLLAALVGAIAIARRKAVDVTVGEVD